MKIRSVFIATAISVMAFVSCNKDNDYKGDGDGRVAVKFQSSIQGTVQPRAAGSTWANGDQIGIFMKNAGQALSDANIVDNAKNKRYETISGNGSFTPLSGNTIYYPESGNVDFVAYYPHSTNTKLNNFVYEVDVTNQTSQEDIDLLYANNATGLNKGTPNATLSFSHKLTKVVFNVSAGTGVANLNGLTIKIAGMKTKADFALANAALTVDGTSTADINVKTTTSGTDVIGEAIVIPVTDAGGSVVTFTIPSVGSFTWTIPASTEYEGGNKYSYDVELKNTGGGAAQTELALTASINDWVGGANESIAIDNGGVTGGAGTQASPYTISQALTKTGESGKWVSGFIVGSTSKTKSFGTPSTENILIAETAGETDETKCIPVDIASSTVKANLDIVAHPELIGTQIKVQGDIVSNIFNNTLSMTNIVAQEGGATPTPPGPTASLVFPGSDFENWSAFLGCLTTHGLKDTYTTQSSNGKTGSALYLNGTPTGNDYVFTATLTEAITTSPTKIVFYIKGTSAKSLSLNIYRSNGTNYDVFNLGNYIQESVLEKANLNSSNNGTNSYTGAIDTNGSWMKVTLNIADLDINKAAGQNIFALKVGKDAAYDLLVDDITFE